MGTLRCTVNSMATYQIKYYVSGKEVKVLHWTEDGAIYYFPKKVGEETRPLYVALTNITIKYV